MSVSPADITALISFAVGLIQRCAAAASEHASAGTELEGVLINLRAARRELKNKSSAIHKPENKLKQRELKRHCDICKDGFRKLERHLDKFTPMDVLGRLRWGALNGKADLDDIRSHLNFVVSRMEAFVLMLNTSLVTAGKIERQVDRTLTAKAAVEKSVRGLKDVSPEERDNLTSYAIRLSEAKACEKDGEAGGKGPARKKSGCFLECWLVKMISDPGMANFTKEKIERGQWKLENMAKIFKDHPGKKKINYNDLWVTWVLRGRNQDETDKQYEWRFEAARVESTTSDDITTDRAMIVIRRHMTQEAEAEFAKRQAGKKDGNKDIEKNEKKDSNEDDRKDGEKDGEKDEKKHEKKGTAGERTNPAAEAPKAMNRGQKKAKIAGGDEATKKDNVKQEKKEERKDQVEKTEEGSKAGKKKKDHHKGKQDTLKPPHKEGGRSRSPSPAKPQAEKKGNKSG